MPPSTEKTWPVFHEDSSEIKNSTACAMSEGEPYRAEKIHESVYGLRDMRKVGFYRFCNII